MGRHQIQFVEDLPHSLCKHFSMQSMPTVATTQSSASWYGLLHYWLGSTALLKDFRCFCNNSLLNIRVANFQRKLDEALILPCFRSHVIQSVIHACGTTSICGGKIHKLWYMLCILMHNYDNKGSRKVPVPEAFQKAAAFFPESEPL